MNGKSRVAIRRAVPGDLPTICEVHNASIRELCTPSYTEEQIREWTGALKPQGYLRAMEVYDFIVAVEGGVVGLCIFNASKAEITALYVSPENAGMGIGRTLVQEVEAMAREAGVRELNLKSTLNAVGFYERMRFIRIESSRYVLPGGTELPCIVMAKRLGREHALPE
ncbi:MAG TPA: GNAT family N-acetyltransferase [Deltaproteobacteria bacterium]|nr:GNAT family N-acetyltransferase [Deltaproteobacteria bacterium]HOI06679.1 GNAT family N-acetyltransferase [Deltaproteobacteria bacterium]